MATILLAWELGAGTGHCVNLHPIAEGLIAKGHAVWFAARDLATARRVFGESPVNYLPAPFLLGGQRQAVERPKTFAQILHNVGFDDELRLRSLTNAWHSLFRLVQPDAIVCEHAPTALFASRWMEMRRFVIGTGFFSPPDRSPLPNIRPGASPEVSLEAQSCERDILERMNSLLREGQRPPLDRLAQLYADVDANFLLTLPELDHYPQRGSLAEYHGSWLPHGGIEPVWRTEGPRIFAYLQPPSANWPLEQAITALRETNCDSLCYVPGMSATWRESHETERLRLAAGPLNLQGITCDAVIHNGNAGTAFSLLLAGIPQLLIPLHMEQAVLSEHVVRLGAGLAMRPSAASRIGTHLHTVLTSELMKAAAVSFSQRHTSYDPLTQQQAIVNRIAACL